MSLKYEPASEPLHISVKVLEANASTLAAAWAAVERIWHRQDSQGQILALAFR